MLIVSRGISLVLIIAKDNSECLLINVYIVKKCVKWWWQKAGILGQVWLLIL